MLISEAARPGECSLRRVSASAHHSMVTSLPGRTRRHRGRRGRAHQLRRRVAHSRCYTRTTLLSCRLGAYPAGTFMDGPPDLLRCAWIWLRSLTWCLTVSCFFAGMGTAELVLESLLRGHASIGGGPSQLVVLWSVDVSKNSLEMLQHGPSLHLGGDLLDVWPPDLLARWETETATLEDRWDDLRRNAGRLRAQLWCHRTQQVVGLNLGMLSISGSPCTDYSPLGLHAGTQGPTVLVLLTFLLLVRLQKPIIMVHENVIRQPLWVFHLCLGDFCRLDSIVLEPPMFRHPVSRRRRYLVASLRGAAAGRVLADLPTLLSMGLPAQDCRLYRRGSRAPRPAFTEWQRHNLWSYLDAFPDALCCDLSPTATKRPRVPYACGHAPVLTSTCSSLFWLQAHRFATKTELGLMQGLPTLHSLARSWNFRFVDFTNFSRSAAGKLIGNGMHVQCVGAVLVWLLAFNKWPSASVPRDLCPGTELSHKVRSLFTRCIGALCTRFGGLQQKQVPARRTKEVYPLPGPRRVDLESVPCRVASPDRALLCSLLEWKVGFLNGLHHNLAAPFLHAGPATPRQRAILCHLLTRLVSVGLRFSSVPSWPTDDPLDRFESASTPPKPPLSARLWSTRLPRQVLATHALGLPLH